MDLFEEIDKIHQRIYLECAFGYDITEIKVEYLTENGSELLSIAEASNRGFAENAYRMFSPQLVLLPESYSWFISPAHRRIKTNSETIRNIFKDLVEKRR